MEDAGTSEEDNIDSQDSNTPIDHGHLARNCLIKIISITGHEGPQGLWMQSMGGSPGDVCEVSVT